MKPAKYCWISSRFIVLWGIEKFKTAQTVSVVVCDWQSRDDVPGARRLGGQGSSAEGGGRQHHQRQVRSLLANTGVRSAGSDRGAPLPPSALTETFASLSHGRRIPSMCCRPWRDWRRWTSTRRPTSSPGEFLCRRTNRRASFRESRLLMPPSRPLSGSMNQFIAVYNSNGDVISNIKYYDGFMGQRIGAISCLAFHPYWVSTDVNPSPSASETAVVFSSKQISVSEVVPLSGPATKNIKQNLKRHNYHLFLRTWRAFRDWHEQVVLKSVRPLPHPEEHTGGLIRPQAMFNSCLKWF